MQRNFRTCPYSNKENVSSDHLPLIQQLVALLICDEPTVSTAFKEACLRNTHKLMLISVRNFENVHGVVHGKVEKCKATHIQKLSFCFRFYLNIYEDERYSNMSQSCSSASDASVYFITLGQHYADASLLMMNNSITCLNT